MGKGAKFMDFMPPGGPKGGQTEDRIEAMKSRMEAAPAPANAGDTTEQRSRQGMKKITIHMRPEARTELRRFAMRNEERQEEFILKAINERLASMGADFVIE